MATKALVLAAALATFIHSQSVSALTPEQQLDQAIQNCLLGHAELANTQFNTIIEQYQPPQGIRAVIDYYRRQSCQHPYSQKNASWQHQIGLEVGESSNVNQGSQSDYVTLSGLLFSPQVRLSEDSKPQADNYHKLSLSSINQTTQLNLSYQNYQQQTDFNILKLGGLWQKKNWLFTANAYIQQTSAYDLAAHYYFQPDLGFKVFLQKNEIQQGIRAGVEGFYTYPLSFGRLYLGLRQDVIAPETLGGGRNGVLAILQGGYELSKGSLSWLFFAHQMYDGDYYSPGLIDTRRQNQLVQADIRYQYPLTSEIQLAVAYRTTISRDAVELFDSETHQFSLSLDYRWR